MFVNVSPADYNSEETASSLAYAARVKTITNNAERMQESAEVARLKRVIAQLRAGGPGGGGGEPTAASDEDGFGADGADGMGHTSPLSAPQAVNGSGGDDDGGQPEPVALTPWSPAVLVPVAGKGGGDSPLGASEALGGGTPAALSSGSVAPGGELVMSGRVRT